MKDKTPSDGENDGKSTDPSYYRNRGAAAPRAGDAAFINDDEEGWCVVLDQVADIETDMVVIALGNPADRSFIKLDATYYSERKDLIFEAEVATDHVPSSPKQHEDYEPATGIVKEINNTSPDP
jgi:hypothetical protein